MSATKVVTYTSPNGESIHITPEQEAAMKAAGVWPKDSRGAEYCSVSRGLRVWQQDQWETESIESLLTARR